MRGYHVLALLALVAGIACASTPLDKDGYNRRMTSEERIKVMKSLDERARTRANTPFCEPINSASNDDDPFPPLPKSFITQTEISFEDSNIVITGEEMFDGVKNAGILKFKLYEGVFITRPHAFDEEIHYSIPKDEALFIWGDNVCEEEGSENCHPLKFCLGGKTKDVNVELKDLFGYSDPNDDEGFLGAAAILEWGPKYGYKTRGRGECRSMDCMIYETCIKVDDSENRLFITYYWSHPEWHLNKENQQVPIAIEIMSSGKMDPVTTKAFNLRFDFYDFIREAKPSTDALQVTTIECKHRLRWVLAFGMASFAGSDDAERETEIVFFRTQAESLAGCDDVTPSDQFSIPEHQPPLDAYCYGMKDGPDIPDTRHYFSYKSETVTGFDLILPDGENQTTTVEFTTVINQEEFYDWDQKIATSKFVPWFLFTEQSRYEFTTFRVQDFNQGLHYSLKIHLGHCSIRPIENITSFGDVIVNEDGSVEMLPPWIYDHMDAPAKYSGEHWTRGILSDVWTGTKKNPIIPFLNDSFVWYYASPMMADDAALLSQSLDGSHHHRKGDPSIFSMDNIPIKFEKYMSLFEALPHKIYNVYQFEEEPPMTHVIDVHSCYPEDKMEHYIFDLPADSLQKVKHLRDKLMYATQTVLAEFGVVSALRINRLQLEERKDSLRVLFTILDKPDVEGDAPGTDLESSMKDAVSLINKALNNHHIVIMVPILSPFYKGEPEIVTVLPTSTSLRKVDRPSTHRYNMVHDRGYTSGSMAGIAFGMLFVGALLGVVVNIVLKRKSASGGPSLPRVSNAQKSSEMPGGSVYLGGNMSGGSDI